MLNRMPIYLMITIHQFGFIHEFIVYFDANSLYGWVMSQSLPTGNFKWVNNVAKFDFMNITEDSPAGYILEVDLGMEFSCTK